MPLTCPSCGKTILPADVNVQADLAKCASCGEVFSPSQSLAGQPEAAPPSSTAPTELPRDSRLQVDEQGGILTIRFPSQGLDVGVVLMAAFAVAWWGFLVFFLGFVLSEGAWLSDDASEMTTEESTLATAEAERHAEPVSKPKEPRQPAPGPAYWFFVLFLTPFCLAGLGMIAGILWPLFGRTEVRMDDLECSYRAFMFGLGRTRRASIEDTILRWHKGLDHPIARYAARMTSIGNGQSRIILTLGRREKPIAGSVSEIEQEWVFERLSERLRQATRARR